MALQAIGSQELPNGDVLVQHRTVHDDQSKIVTEWFFLQGGDGRSYRVNQWLYSGRELRAMLERAGFAHVVLYGGLDGEAYGPDAPGMIAVARKGALPDGFLLSSHAEEVRELEVGSRDVEMGWSKDTTGRGIRSQHEEQ